VVETLQILYIKPDLLFEIACLATLVKDRTCELKDYLNYLIDYLPTGTIGLFGVFEEQKLLGFLHCEEGHPIEPDKAFILLAASYPDIPLKVKRKLLKKAESWMKSKGAKKWQMATTRKQLRAFNRLYGLTLSDNEHIMEKKING